MYKSSLHDIILKTMEATTWTRSTKDEDNFRQIICSSLYNHISPSNVEIPSTRSGHGDIKIFGRKIELKYASNEKREQLKDIIDDFSLLLESKIEFSIVSIKLDVSPTDNFLHRCIHMPMLAKTGSPPSFGDLEDNENTYKQISIFLAATYPHAVTTVTLREGKGKNSTAYLSFETTSSISRSSFLELPECLIHIDVVGSKEDGLVSFIFKRANNLVLEDIEGTEVDICIPYEPNPIFIAKSRSVNAYSKSKKSSGGVHVNSTCIASEVPCIKIYDLTNE